MSPKRFKDIRVSTGLTQDAFGKYLGLAKLSVSQFETGFRKPGKQLVLLMSYIELLNDRKRHEFLKVLREIVEKEFVSSSGKVRT
ncbi:MAG TPA: hypothetical protein VIG33_03020 [Pseudobdellovibrionaceae bacterium]